MSPSLRLSFAQLAILLALATSGCEARLGDAATESGAVDRDLFGIGRPATYPKRPRPDRTPRPAPPPEEGDADADAEEGDADADADADVPAIQPDERIPVDPMPVDPMPIDIEQEHPEEFAPPPDVVDVPTDVDVLPEREETPPDEAPPRRPPVVEVDPIPKFPVGPIDMPPADDYVDIPDLPPSSPLSYVCGMSEEDAQRRCKDFRVCKYKHDERDPDVLMTELIPGQDSCVRRCDPLPYHLGRDHCHNVGLTCHVVEGCRCPDTRKVGCKPFSD